MPVEPAARVVAVDAEVTAAATDDAELRDEIDDGLRNSGARLLYWATPFDDPSTPKKLMEIESKAKGKSKIESANTSIIWHW